MQIIISQRYLFVVRRKSYKFYSLFVTRFSVSNSDNNNNNTIVYFIKKKIIYYCSVWVVSIFAVFNNLHIQANTHNLVRTVKIGVSHVGSVLCRILTQRCLPSRTTSPTVPLLCLCCWLVPFGFGLSRSFSLGDDRSLRLAAAKGRITGGENLFLFVDTIFIVSKF